MTPAETEFRAPRRAARPGTLLGVLALGGTTQRVLACKDLYFVVATQMWHERSEAHVVAVARAVLTRV